MTDLLTATQDAVFAALNVPAVTALAPVYQHVPENTQPPMIIVGDIEAEAGETKGSEDHSIEIYTVFRGKGRRGVLALMHAARTTLEAAHLTAPGADLERAEWQNSAAVGAEDGVTYAGTQTFKITIAQA